MRNLICTIPLLLLLTACSNQGSNADTLALEFRTAYLTMQSCAGKAEIFADYGERVYAYTVDFTWEKDGAMTLSIVEPKELSGMTAQIQNGESSLSFDGAALETGPLSPEGLSPIDVIPAALGYVCEGYIAECGTEGLDARDTLRLQLRTPEVAAGQGSEAVLWLDRKDGSLLRAEMLQDGITVIRCEFLSFQMA